MYVGPVTVLCYNVNRTVSWPAVVWVAVWSRAISDPPAWQPDRTTGYPRSLQSMPNNVKSSACQADRLTNRLGLQSTRQLHSATPDVAPPHRRAINPP